MKIIHCSDLHIDSKMQTNLPKDKAIERKKEILILFENMVAFAKNESVSVIIIAGDMFDSNKITKTTKNRIYKLMESNPSIDFVYLPGNHDENSIICSFENDLPNLKVFGSEWTSFKYGNIIISGVNELSNSRYLELDLQSENINIVVLHGQITKYSSSNGEEIILPKLQNKNIDYLALGHIHSYSANKLDERGIYCYSGCLEGRGFDECGQKGFVLIESDGKKIKHNFVPFSKRVFHEIEYNLNCQDSWYEIEQDIMDKLSYVNSCDFVKLILVGNYQVNLEKDLTSLAKKMESRFYCYKIKDLSTLLINAEDYKNDASLKGEFIRQVLSSNLPNEECDRIIMTGLKVLNGEEIE